MEKLPVFNIKHFQPFDGDLPFYAEDIRSHIDRHHFVSKPHKHDFFVVVLFTKGSGVHEVDFTSYPIRPGSLFLLNPGQSHCWNLSRDIDGILFFHSRLFFDSGLSTLQLNDFSFFNSIHNPPLVNLKKAVLAAATSLFEEILKEYKQARALKEQRLLSLVSLLYINVSRSYSPRVPVKSERYLSKLRQFEALLDAHFKDLKLPSGYADLMCITERHLNRITKTCLNQTPTGLILDRNMLEARRLLLHDQASVSDVGAQLGYPDNSYFSRLFKKHTGKTPREFANGYR